MAKPHSTDVIDQVTGFITGANLSVNAAVASDKIISEDSEGADIAKE